MPAPLSRYRGLSLGAHLLARGRLSVPAGLHLGGQLGTAEALNYSRTVDTDSTDGPPPMGNTPGERVYLARRVAEALTVLHFGGPRGQRPTGLTGTEGGGAA